MPTAMPRPSSQVTLVGRLLEPDRARILILGARHLVLVLREYVIHYDRHRPHRYPATAAPDVETQSVRAVADLRSVRRKPVVAGVINEYHHAA